MGRPAGNQAVLETFSPLVAHHSGKCMAVVNNSMSNGAKVQQWTCQPSNAAMYWSVIPVDNGAYYLIRNYLSVLNGNPLCLDLPSPNYPVFPPKGTQLALYSCLGTPNQGWRAEGSSAVGNFILKNMGTGMLVTVAGGSHADGAAIDQWPHASQPNQSWS